MGASEVASRGMRGGRGRTPTDRANKLAQGSRALRARARALIPAPGLRLIEAWALEVRAPGQAGAPSDGMWGVSMVGQTSVRRSCYGSYSMRSRSRGQGRRGSNQSLGSICSRQVQTLITLQECRSWSVSVPR
jgi:hypothetical protein